MPTSLSVSPLAAELLAGEPQTGVGLGHGHVLFRDHVLAITPPGALRMPNGIESELVVATGERVSAGDGELRTKTASLTAGPLWDPRPRPGFSLSLRPQPRLRLDELAGRGPGLTPLGDDILVGYLARAALTVAESWVGRGAEWAGRQTTALSRTLLFLAARGELPEAAHGLLVSGNLGPLLRFGATSGRGIAFGLALGARGAMEARARELSSRSDVQSLELSVDMPAARSPWHWTGEVLIAPAS